MRSDFRHQAGKHLTLVEDDHLPYIANIRAHVVPTFATWFEFCQEARDLVKAGRLPDHMLDRVQAVEHFLQNNLKLTPSINGRGRSDLVAAIRGLEEDQIHRDRGYLPVAPERARSERPGADRGLVPGGGLNGRR